MGGFGAPSRDAFGPSGSFHLATSQSSVSINNSVKHGPSSRQEFGRNSVRLATMGNGTSHKLGQTPLKMGLGVAHRPSNATLADRSTAMHSAMPSPSLGMFKMNSFNNKGAMRQASGAAYGKY